MLAAPLAQEQVKLGERKSLQKDLSEQAVQCGQSQNQSQAGASTQEQSRAHGIQPSFYERSKAWQLPPRPQG